MNQDIIFNEETDDFYEFFAPKNKSLTFELSIEDIMVSYI